MTLQERFSDKFIPEPNSGCWLWTAAATKQGYGVFNMDGSGIGAHRASWIMENGDIPDGLCVCHKCDVPSCVNPEHLFLGTYKENTQDMIRKGRRVEPDPTNRMRGEYWRNAHAGTLPTGENHHSAKLTEHDVRDIRASNELGIDIAKRFNVSGKTISRIRRFETWRDVPFHS